MTVKDLREKLDEYPDDMVIGYYLYSEQCVLEEKDIETKELCETRPDGWIQNYRPDKKTQTYLLFPGN